MSCFNIAQNKSFLASVFFISLLLRTLLFFGFLRNGENYLAYFDTAQYQAIANNVVQGNGISVSPEVPNFYRLPGYPLFLAFCYKVHEKISYKINKDHLAALIQLVFASLLPIFVFCLSQVLLPDMIVLARFVSIVSSIHIGFISYSGILATEILFTLIFIIFFILFFQDRSVLAGVALGMASLIRPVGHFIIPVAVIMILFFNLKKSLLKRLQDSIFLAFAWIMTVSWWLVRNWLLTGMIFFHTLPGLHFLQYVTAKIVMDIRGCSYVEARGALLDEWKEAIIKQECLSTYKISEPEKCTIAEKITCSYLSQRPFVALKNGLCEMMKTVFGLYSAQMVFSDAQEWGDYSIQSNILIKIKKYLFPSVKTWYLIPLVWYDIIFSIFLLLGFCIFCIKIFCDQKAFYLGLKILPFMFLLIGLTCAYGCARLRLPIEPLLVISSCFGWMKIFERIWRNQND